MVQFSELRRKVRTSPQKAYEVTHPNVPWLTQRAVRYLNSNLDRDGVGWEFGSGRSTAWFAKRLRSLTSIEHDPDWYEKVKVRLDGIENVELILCDVQGPRDENEYVRIIDRVPDQSLSFVLVDGQHREGCVVAVLPKLRPGGLLAVDNTDRPSWVSFLAETVRWPMVHQSRTVRTQTTIWKAP